MRAAVNQGTAGCPFPMEGAADVALVDRTCAAGGEDQPVDVAGAVGCAVLLAVAPRLELGGDLGTKRDRAPGGGGFGVDQITPPGRAARQPFRGRGPVSQRDWDDAHLLNAIIDIHADDPEYGYRFIADEREAVGRSGERWTAICLPAVLTRPPGVPLPLGTGSGR
jgi:hypothetical protein